MMVSRILMPKQVALLNKVKIIAERSEAIYSINASDNIIIY